MVGVCSEIMRLYTFPGGGFPFKPTRKSLGLHARRMFARYLSKIIIK